MFRKTSPLQSKSEILLRNITVTGMLLFYTEVGADWDHLQAAFTNGIR